jgi:hypothetical protein
MVLTKIDAIRFAEDFDLLSQTEKSAWLDRAFFRQHYGHLPDFIDQVPPNLPEDDRIPLGIWKKHVGRVTTARNRLRALFLQVDVGLFLSQPHCSSPTCVVWCDGHIRPRLESQIPSGASRKGTPRCSYEFAFQTCRPTFARSS